jgi:hypothetical protein
MVQHDVDGYSRRGIEFRLTCLQNRDEPTVAAKRRVDRVLMETLLAAAG